MPEPEAARGNSPAFGPAVWPFVLGGSLLVLFAAVLVVSTAGFFLGAHVGAWVFAPASVAEIGYAWFAWRETDRPSALRRTVVTVTVSVLMLIVSGAVASRIADSSEDGRHYHIESVLALSHGWNPVRDHALRWPTVDPVIWTNSYPKGIWTVQAALLRSGANLESTKLVGIVVLLAAMGIAFAGLIDAGLGAPIAVVLAATLALNPVATSQLFTHMVDGVVASLLLIVTILAMLWVWGRARRLVLPVLAAALLLLVNAKFTGLELGVVAVGGVVVLGGAVARLGRRIVSMLAGLAACLAVAVLFIGFNPYVTNTLRHHNPLYPVYGADAVPIAPQANVGSFRHASALHRLVVSLISASHEGAQEPRVKVPLTFTLKEWYAFRFAEVRVGGFGPLFSGALLISLAALIALAIVRRRRHLQFTTQVWTLLIGSGLCVVATLMTPRDSFIARFVPQLWLAPLLAIAAIIVLHPRGLLRILASVGIVILLLNAGGAALAALRWNIKDSQRQAASLHSLRALHRPYAEFGYWERNERRRLVIGRVHYQAVRRAVCPTGLLLDIGGSLTFVDPTTIP